MYGKQAKMRKLGKLDARSSEIVRFTKSWPTSETLWHLDYNAEWTTSLHCVPWPVGWSEWSTSLTPFNFEVSGGKWLLKGSFSKILPTHFYGTRIPVLPPNSVKIGRWEVGEKLCVVVLLTKPCSMGPVWVPFSPSGPIAPKIPRTLFPLDLCICTKFGRDRLRFAVVIPERFIFRTPKVITIESLPCGFQFQLIKIELKNAATIGLTK